MQITHRQSPWQTQSRTSAYTMDLVNALNAGMILPQDYATTFDACAQCGTPAMCRKPDLPNCGPATLVRELRAF